MSRCSGEARSSTSLLAASPRAADRRPAARWPGGHRSLVDQVCLDIPPSSYEVECAYWRDLTGESLDETARHLALGASVVRTHEMWTVLRDPTGALYCVTDRDPRTGLLV